jgi:hypothetical protein
MAAGLTVTVFVALRSIDGGCFDSMDLDFTAAVVVGVDAVVVATAIGHGVTWLRTRRS